MKQRPLREDPYHKLREAIVSGQFHPNERLVEAAIAERIGAGRTAVRAALVRLDQEGLVELERNRGARVRHISDGEAAGTAMREHLAEVLDTLRWAIDSQHRTARWLPG